MTIYEKLKVGLLGIFVVGFILCFHEHSQNGRYIFSNNNDGIPLIIDSNTGETYSIKSREKLSLDSYKRVK